MINTLKITDFVNPQQLLNNTNSKNEGILFSDWDNNLDKKYLVSTLLFEHISMIHTNNINTKKLMDIAYKVNFDAPRKLLLLLHSKLYFLYELVDINTVIASVGEMDDLSFPIYTQKIVKKQGEIGFLYQDIVNHIKDTTRYDNYNKRQLLQGLQHTSTFLLFYFLFVEIEEKIVKPGEKYKPKKYEGFVNKQKRDFVVADISWAIETINNIPFGVSGHFRNQKVGIGKQESKLIYIAPFFKKGYNKKAMKERELM